MHEETIGKLTFHFEVKGKYACIKKITRVDRSDESLINTLVIPEKVHYQGISFEVNALSGRLIRKEYYKQVTTDRRRKDYGKTVPTGRYETDIVDLLQDLMHYISGYRVYHISGEFKIILPETIREIGQYAFCGNHHEDGINIKLNNGLKAIRQRAFIDIKKGKVEIPYSVKIIEEGAFWCCFDTYLIVDNEPGSIKGIEKCGIYKDNIIFLRPKTSWFSRLIKKIIPNH